MHQRFVYFTTGLSWETRKCMGREKCKVSGQVIQLIKRRKLLLQAKLKEILTSRQNK